MEAAALMEISTVLSITAGALAGILISLVALGATMSSIQHDLRRIREALEKERRP